ncbi:Early nodulin-like protein 1 [Abeliophyllum distichum]|uniref:Early nodulin-like protein 1 n=1 Tax=Abeliophyllum distichum TaxID=126358 RepID=A0ABD1PNM5_9LAMI
MASLVAVIVVVAAALVQAAAASAKTYIVGDSLGWQVPPGGVVVYSDWASQHKFMAGDILVFNFTSGHSVATVSMDDFDACNTDHVITLKENGPVNYTLDSGDTYFICLVDDHCVEGQQLAVTASAIGSPTSSPAPRSSPDGPSGNNTPLPLPQPSLATRVITTFVISIALVITNFC